MRKLTRNDLLDSSMRGTRYGNQIMFKKAMKARLERIKNTPKKEENVNGPRSTIVDVEIKDASDIALLESSLLELTCMGLNIKTRLFVEAV